METFSSDPVYDEYEIKYYESSEWDGDEKISVRALEDDDDLLDWSTMSSFLEHVDQLSPKISKPTYDDYHMEFEKYILEIFQEKI